MKQTRIIKFKDAYGQDVWMAQKKCWFSWKPLNWAVSWHHTIEHAKEEIDNFIRKESIKSLPTYEVIDYP